MLLGALLATSQSRTDQTAKLIGRIDGHEVGSATYARKLLPDKSWEETLTSKMEVPGASLESDFKIHFSADGHAISEEDKEMEGDSVKEDSTVKFENGLATVTNKLTGTSKTFNAPSDPSWIDPSDSWFVKTKPKIGDKAVASSFSIEEGWRTTTVTYLSDKPFKLGDQTIQGHELRHENPKDSHVEIVDDQGLPLEIEVPGAQGLHFTRTPYTDL
jgi:hypothetical protein